MAERPLTPPPSMPPGVPLLDTHRADAPRVDVHRPDAPRATPEPFQLPSPFQVAFRPIEQTRCANGHKAITYEGTDPCPLCGALAQTRAAMERALASMDKLEAMTDRAHRAELEATKLKSTAPRNAYDRLEADTRAIGYAPGGRCTCCGKDRFHAILNTIRESVACCASCNVLSPAEVVSIREARHEWARGTATRRELPRELLDIVALVREYMGRRDGAVLLYRSRFRAALAAWDAYQDGRL